MNKHRHTPEPWSVVGPVDDGLTVVKIAGPEGWLGVAQAFGDTVEEAEENARRIVACVNYCEGMSNDELGG